ncbi:MAG: hypothetical protein JNL74_19770, partial [Fibrobacteres bacterium]|nr:hypothetical protein [Fibrobacterota bacterium]
MHKKNTIPNRMRPAPFWSWNGELKKDELIKQVHDMADKGWSGFFMHSRAGLITPYLSPEWFDLVRTCAVEAGKRGTDAWLYDEDKWPSGFAGGLVAEADPAFRMKALTAVSPDKFDNKTMKILKKSLFEGKEWIIASWHAPLDNPWFNYASYIDTMNTDAVDKFLEITIDGYKKEVGEFFGKEIPGIFTDEPCYLYSGRHVAPGYLPWTTDLPARFKKDKGYDLLKNIDQLFLKTGNFRKTRFDFFDIATKLFTEAWSMRYHAKCKKNKLIYTGHMMAEDTLEEQTRWSGAVMPHYEHMDWPGIDKLSRHTQQTVTVKQVSSVAEQLDKERTFCEVFGCTGHSFHFQGRRWIHNWEAALGINFVNHHLSHYTLSGERKRDYPPNFFYQQPYWPYEKGMSDYLGRVNMLLTEGRRHIDILVLHPIGTAWSEFDVLSYYRNITPSVWSIDLQKLTDTLLSNRLDFHFGDETILDRHGKCKNKEIEVGAFRYKTIIIPPSITWKSGTFKLLKSFSKNGGKIIFAGTMPTFIDMGETADYLKLLPGSIHTPAIQDAITLLNKRHKTIIADDIDTGANAATLFSHARKMKDGKMLYFVTNIAETKCVNAAIKLPAAGLVEEYNWETGDWKKCPTESVEGNSQLTHFFEAGEAVAYRVNSKLKAYKKKEIQPTSESINITDWQVKAIDKNVLRVETVDYSINGQSVFRNGPVSRVWPHFNNEKDGASFEVTYHFNVASNLSGTIHAVVENAQNLSSIRFNGKPIEQTGKTWLDIEFNTIDITKL